MNIFYDYNVSRITVPEQKLLSFLNHYISHDKEEIEIKPKGNKFV